MTHVGFATIPGYGHTYPVLPLAEAMQRVGARVTLATGAPLLDALPFDTVPGVAPGTTIGGFIDEVRARYGDWLTSPERFLAAAFGDVQPRLTIPALRQSWRRDRPDLVVHESLNVGAAVVADELGIPSVTFGIGLWHPELGAFRAVAERAPDRTDATPAPWDLLPAGMGRPLTYLDPFPPDLQPVMAEPRPTRTLTIRPDGWADPAAAAAFEVPGRGDRPLVYVTLGTVSFGAVTVIRQVIGELTGRDVDVAVGAGPEAQLDLLGELPGNVRAYRHLPQADLLPRVAVVVSHGGAGTMLTSAGHGIPQLLLPQGADHFLNADAVESAGIGRALRGDGQFVPGAVGSAVDALLADGSERRRAGQVAGAIAAMPAPDAVAADLLARLGAGSLSTS